MAARSARAPLLALVLLALAPGCDAPSGGPSPSAGSEGAAAARTTAPPGRVWVVGLDGASFEVIDPMIASGRLPNLARLRDEGASGMLRVGKPLLSPRVWTTIATGRTPERHGIASWVYRGEDDRVHIYESVQREGPALWNIASARGLTVATVNWLMTYPPEKIDGVVVSDHALPQEHEARLRFGEQYAQLTLGRGVDDPGGDTAPVVYPPSWQQRLLPAITSREPVAGSNPFDRSLNGVALWFQLSHFFWNEQRAVRIALAIDRELQPDVTLVLLQGIDRVSHALWGTLRPETAPGLSEEKRRAGRRALLRTYENADLLLGALLERVGPDDLVVVLSDHGFEHVPGQVRPDWGGTHVSDRAARGVAFLRGPGIPAGLAFDDLSELDVTPTVLAWLGIPVARDMDGRPAPFLDRTVAWVESWDHLPIAHAGPGGSPVEPAMLEQLEALGYLDREDAPAAR